MLKKQQQNFFGLIYIHNTSNNIIITITNLNGKTITWVSAGSAGFTKGARSSAYALEQTALQAGKKSIEHNIKSVKLLITGLPFIYKKLIKGFKTTGINILKIQDRTSVPHGMQKARKYRRR